MNILIKLTCLVGLVIAPILGEHINANTHNNETTSHVIEERVIEIADETDGSTVEFKAVEVDGVKTIEFVSGSIEDLDEATILKLEADGFDLSSFMDEE
ncbi:MAG: hypothetical protein KDE33_26585, partial [Bacteroidetes bacterium]|nr:hypothetical protein [Bacteroidota bacterium]